MARTRKRTRTHTRQPKPETQRLLSAASHFLLERNFPFSKSYALQAQTSDPNNPNPTRILSIISVLTSPDHYSTLNLPKYEPDISLITSTFKNLSSILNPLTNPYPLCSEAFASVKKAWSVLSDPVEKERFDNELKGVCTTTSFWTMCPYCWFVYEYESVYVDCCLRCVNDECRRGFHAVEIKKGPSKEVVEAGVYCCSGFLKFGGGDQCLWDPFGVSDENDGCYFNSDELIVDFEDGTVDNVEVGEERRELDEDGDGGFGDWFGGEWNVDDMESGVVEGIDDILVGLLCDYDFGY